jgi:predicted permease
MRWTAYLAEAFDALLRRRTVEKEMDEELRFHLEMEIEKNVRAGMTREEARRIACIRFGGVERVKEEVREERGVRPLEDLMADVRYAVRQLRKNPGFAAVAIVTLALGIGANTAVFSVLHRVILTPLGFDEPERLVRVYQTHESYGGGIWVSGPAFLDYREKTDAFEHAAAIYNYQEMGFTLTGNGPPRRVTQLQVSSDFFDVYRSYPTLGRRFHREEERSSARVAVLSHRLWKAISSEESVPGQQVLLDGDAIEVIGVMPAGFEDVVGGDVDLWMPLELQDEGATQNRGNHYLSVIARLRSGVTLEQARAQLDALSVSQAELYPSEKGWAAEVEPLYDNVVGNAGTMLYLLLGAASLVLLIACVNVASLFLARNITRERELALRSAIGAGRFRLVRQLLTESLTVAIVGGLAGLALAYWGVKTLLPLASEALPRADEVTFDATLFVFALAMALVTVVVFGLAPALRFSGPKLGGSLREHPRTSTRGARGRRVRDVLVMSQVALAILLLVGAGLFMRSLVKLQHLDLGIRSTGVMTFEVHLGGPRYTEPAARIAFHQDFQGRLDAHPDIKAASAISRLPVSDVFNSWTFSYLSASGEVMEHGGGADFRIIEGDYFGALGIELLSGRYFESTDDSDAPAVAIVNQSLARRYYEGRDPLEQYIAADRVWRIVGVVNDVAHDSRGSTTPKVYLPHGQFGDNRNWALTQVVATSIPRREFFEIARRELAAIDPQLVMHNRRAMREVTGAAIARERFTFTLMGVFAALALSLAVVGLYGVMAYTVGQRTQEFGVRLAIGATPGGIRWSVFQHGTVIVGVGVAVGLLAALAVSRLLESMLYGVSATDPLTYLLVPLALMTTALLAGVIPARRATKVDPVEALRYE